MHKTYVLVVKYDEGKEKLEAEIEEKVCLVFASFEDDCEDFQDYYDLMEMLREALMESR